MCWQTTPIYIIKETGVLIIKNNFLLYLRYENEDINNEFDEFQDYLTRKEKNLGEID